MIKTLDFIGGLEDYSYLYCVEIKGVNIQKENELLRAENKKLQLELDDLKQTLSKLQRMIFGRKSEGFVPSDESQLKLFEDTLAKKEEEQESEKYTVTYKRDKKPKKNEKPIRTAIPASFPRVEEIVYPENIDPSWVKIGQEVTELLEIKPSEIFVRRIVRPKYALPNEEGIAIADLPSLPIPKGNASASVLTFIIISKIVDHLPFYRIIQILKRQGLNISKSTMNGWFIKASELLMVLYEAYKEDFLKDIDYIQSDESPIKVQDKDKKKTTHRGYMWVYRDPEKRLVLFDYHKGRGRNVPEDFLKDFNGTLQTDGYAVYQNLTTKGDITLLGCMAHARRYFENAMDNDPRRAEHVLFMIQKLYRIERKLRERKVSVDVIKRYRIKYALPILNDMEKYLNEEKVNVLPKSSIGKAIFYTLNIYDNLKQYVYDGRFEIDNNNIENVIRPLAIGRKNYLFAGSHEAAQNLAMFYSFFATCKTHDINPYKWLLDVLNRIPEHKANKLFELFPQNWKELNNE